RRLQYLGSPEVCCTSSGMTTYGNVTCDPQYREGPQSSQCSNPLKNLCDFNNLTNPVFPNFPSCTTWCQANPDLCKDNKFTFCNDLSNLELASCQEFANANGGMDTA